MPLELEIPWTQKPPYGTKLRKSFVDKYKPSLVLPFNEPAGKIAYDISGNNIQGVLNGGVTRVITNQGLGLKFDGSTGYEITSAAPPKATNVFISCLVTLKSISATQAIAMKDDLSANREWQLFFTTSGNTFGFWPCVGSFVSATAFGTPKVGVPYYLYGWLDRTNNIIGIGVNGIENTLSSTVSQVTGTGTNIILGKQFNVGLFLNGAISQATYLTATPSPSQRAALYANPNNIYEPRKLYLQNVTSTITNLTSQTATQTQVAAHESIFQSKTSHSISASQLAAAESIAKRLSGYQISSTKSLASETITRKISSATISQTLSVSQEKVNRELCSEIICDTYSSSNWQEGILPAKFLVSHRFADQAIESISQRNAPQNPLLTNRQQ